VGGCFDGGDADGQAGGDDRDSDERGADADDVSDAAEQRPDDEAEHGQPEDGAERLSAALARNADGDPRERSRPGGRARYALCEPCDPQRDGATGEREAQARERQKGEARQDSALRTDPADEQPSRDPSHQRTPAVRPEEDAGFELRQVVVVGEAGEERDDRAEEHRVEEDDRARDGDDATHLARIRRGCTSPGTKENAPSRSRLRPAHPIDLRRSDCRAGGPSTFGAPCSVHPES
jgi:hypothetical protein